MTDRAELELHAREGLRRVADAARSALPPGVGFALFVFDFGEKGNLAYVSTAARADMLKAIREWLEKAEADAIRSVFTGPGGKA
jgi:hypothetical protein